MKPHVLASHETIEEINSQAQHRLEERRKNNSGGSREEKYLFGSPKIKLPPYKRVVYTSPVDLSPRYIYYR